MNFNVSPAPHKFLCKKSLSLNWVQEENACLLVLHNLNARNKIQTSGLLYFPREGQFTPAACLRISLLEKIKLAKGSRKYTTLPFGVGGYVPEPMPVPPPLHVPMPLDTGDSLRHRGLMTTVHQPSKMRQKETMKKKRYGTGGTQRMTKPVSTGDAVNVQ